MKGSSAIERQVRREVIDTVKGNGLSVAGVKHQSTDRNIDVDNDGG